MPAPAKTPDPSTTPVSSEPVSPRSTMRDVLAAFPGAQRTLFRRYHIGGCSSCAFQPSETLEELCRRNNNLNVAEVLAVIQESHEEDARVFITPTDLKRLLETDPSVRLVDVRSRDEFDAVHIDGSVLLSQPVMLEIMGKWDPEKPFVIVDHQGKQALDAAAYFLGHGFPHVRCLLGGIDAWSREVDPTVRRYEVN